MSKTKLELTRPGKHTDLQLEPRILIEKPELSNNGVGSENMLIHGDNLLALKALEQEFSGQVKCIYIDPPYNTGNAFEHYDDGLEHSQWLSLMKPRLELLRSLLADDGIIFVQIDDGEMAYLKVIMDEIFGRENFINSIIVTMSNLSGPKIRHARTGKRFPKIKEYILVFSKDNQRYKLNIPKQQKEKRDKEYNLIIPQITKDDYLEIMELIENHELNLLNEKIKNYSIESLNDYVKNQGIHSSKYEEWFFENAYRIVGSKPNNSLSKIVKTSILPDNPLYYLPNSSGDLKLIRTDYNKSTDTPRLELLFAEDMLSMYYGDLWTDIATTGGIAQEGGVIFTKSKKPEKLVSRIIDSCTNPGDLVLDSFLGSGTTTAVAHKMGRRWIGIELGDHAYTHAKVRMDKVIEGEQGGISKAVNRQGGGGYKFYELGPSVLIKDQYDNYIINPEFDATMLIQWCSEG